MSAANKFSSLTLCIRTNNSFSASTSGSCQVLAESQRNMDRWLIHDVCRDMLSLASSGLTDAVTLEVFEPFHSRLLHSNQSMRNAVLLDQVQITSHYGEQLWQTLHAHLREHLVKVRDANRFQSRCFLTSCYMQIGPEFFKQKTGIPQGSKVSSLLCTLYYGHLERSHLKFINKESSVRAAVAQMSED